MFDKLKRLLGANDDASAASLEAALAEIDLEGLREAQSRIGLERQALLLTGTDEQVLDAERRLDVTRLDIERATLAHDALTTRLNATMSKEAEDAIRAAHASATVARNDYMAKLDRELPAIVKMVNGLIDEGNAVFRKVSAANAPICASSEYGLPAINTPGQSFIVPHGKLSELPHWIIQLFQQNLRQV